MRELNMGFERIVVSPDVIPGQGFTIEPVTVYPEGSRPEAAAVIYRDGVPYAFPWTNPENRLEDVRPPFEPYGGPLR